jgi:hypothetical protein
MGESERLGDVGPSLKFGPGDSTWQLEESRVAAAKKGNMTRDRLALEDKDQGVDLTGGQGDGRPAQIGCCSRKVST